MTPGARVAAAIEILETMSDGLAAEQALTRWARQSRFAGSKDRAAVRDHVYDVLRIRQTANDLGGGTDGRSLMIGLLHAKNIDLSAYFTGQGHAPEPLSAEEAKAAPQKQELSDRLNFPDWLWPEVEKSLHHEAKPTVVALQSRAPITVRVNSAKATRDKAAEMLMSDGIVCQENSLSKTALTLVEGARKLRNSKAYQEGFVELQDAASQAVVDLLPLAQKCLDYCAGGGGKALALAAQPNRRVFVHDIDARRMRDIGVRADRAGCEIKQVSEQDLTAQAPFDLVLCDAPCSGSGAWRRSPEGKWTLTAEKLRSLNGTQDDILRKAALLTHDAGTLVYATCSFLQSENEDRIDKFLAENECWKCVLQRRFPVDSEGDGFFTAHLTQDRK